MLLKIVVKRLSQLAIILMVLAVLSGCEAIRSMDSLNGILAGNKAVNADVEMLYQAETAYFKNDFDLAKTLYRKVKQNSDSPEYKNQAQYGLSCLAIIAANDITELRKSFRAIRGWQQPENIADSYQANPRMLIVALDKKANLLNCETEIKVVTTEKKKEVNKEHQQEIEQLKQTIQKLKHQISVLEAIDQEIQEKRKPI